MRFDPKLPDDSVNVSEQSLVREVLWLVAGATAATVLMTAALALCVEALMPLVPASLEVRLFAGLADAIPAQEDEADGSSEPLRLRVQALLDRLAAHDPDSPYPSHRLQIVEESEPNAFALPGGTILVTRGLLDRIESENELAFVLGHELGHFAGRDHLRGVGRGLSIALVSSALGLHGAPIQSLTDAASGLSARHFDREQESAADEFGATLLIREYGHLGGLRGVFEHVLEDPPAPESAAAGEASGTATSGLERVASYLSTHPRGPDRIQAIESEFAHAGAATDGPQSEWKALEASEIDHTR